MKNWAVAALLAVSSAMAFAADGDSVSGKWSIHASVAGNDSDTLCTFTQKDSELTGTCKTDTGEGKLVGKVDGNKVSWSYDSEYNGSPLTVKYAGTFDSAAKKITGTLSVEQFGVDGEFTATPAK